MLLKVFFFNFAAYASVQRERRLWLRVLLAFILLFALILCQLYISLLYSMLAVPVQKPPLDSAEDLLRVASPTSGYRFYMQRNSFILNAFVIATPDTPLSYAIGRKFNTTPNSVFTHQSEVARLLDASPTNVVFANRFGIEVYSAAHTRAPIHLGSVNLDDTLVGVVFQKGSPLVAPFNDL